MPLFKNAVMNLLKLFFAFCMVLFIGHPVNAQPVSKPADSLRKLILGMEKSFESDLNAKGVAFAFAKYAAPDAVIRRERDTLIIGRDAISNYYSATQYQGARAYWTPDFIDVSSDGSFAYTYGKYRWVFTNQNGQETEYKGVFQTIWKKQPDGQWRYVWD